MGSKVGATVFEHPTANIHAIINSKGIVFIRCLSLHPLLLQDAVLYNHPLSFCDRLNLKQTNLSVLLYLYLHKNRRLLRSNVLYRHEFPTYLHQRFSLTFYMSWWQAGCLHHGDLYNIVLGIFYRNIFLIHHHLSLIHI